MPNWKKVIVSGSDAILNSIDVNGTGSIDYLEVNDRLQGNGSGFQFFAYNEDTVKTKFANWYSSNDRQYGMGQLWFETWFAAIDDQAQRDNRRIGFYLEQPNSGSSDAEGGTGGHPTNSRFHVDVNGAYLSGSLNVESSITGSDVTIDDWGSVSSSLASIDSSIDNYGEWNLAGEADTTDVTSQKFVKFTGGQSITGTGTEANPYIMTIVPSSLGNTTTIDSTSDAQLILDRAANSNDSEILFKTNGTTNWSIGTGQIGSETEFTFKGQDGSNYIRINQSGQADFLSAVTASAVHIGDYTEIESNRLTIADGGDATVTRLAVATYCGVFVDYTIYSTDAGQTNMRTGTYRAAFNDSEVQDSETMTNDIGDTNGFVLSVSLDGTNFTLTANNDIGQQCRVSYTVKPIKL